MIQVQIGDEQVSAYLSSDSLAYIELKLGSSFLIDELDTCLKNGVFSEHQARTIVESSIMHHGASLVARVAVERSISSPLVQTAIELFEHSFGIKPHRGHTQWNSSESISQS